MKNSIQQFHKQFTDIIPLASKADLKAVTKRKVQNIYLAGLGGSSLPIDIVNDVYAGQLAVAPHRTYGVPAGITPKDLLIVSSYSGNTEETVSSLESALKKKIPVVVVTHGGKLLALAKKHKLPLMMIPECIQPRCATGYFYGSILTILYQLKKISNPAASLKKIGKFLEAHQPIAQSAGEQLAQLVKNRIPVLYGAAEIESALRIGKIKINENCKAQAFYNVIPELNHNEMVGWTLLKMAPTFLYFHFPKQHKRISRRIEVMKKILGDKIPFAEIQLKGKSLAEHIFYANLVVDYMTLAVAEAYGVEPAPVAMVEDFKKMLG